MNRDRAVLTWTFFLLAQHGDVTERIREEVTCATITYTRARGAELFGERFSARAHHGGGARCFAYKS